MLHQTKGDKAMKNTVSGIFGLAGVLIVVQILIFAAVVFGIVKGCQVIQEKGLKNTVEGIWEGPTNETAEVTAEVTSTNASGTNAVAPSIE